MMEPFIFDNETNVNLDIFESDNYEMLENCQMHLCLNISDKDINKYKFEVDKTGLDVGEIYLNDSEEYTINIIGDEGTYILSCIRISDNVVVDTMTIEIID